MNTRTAAAQPTPKELLALDFQVGEDITANITHAEAKTFHAELALARSRGENPDANATIAVLMAARSALETELIYSGS
jgi:hypothetical protein